MTAAVRFEEPEGRNDMAEKVAKQSLEQDSVPRDPKHPSKDLEAALTLLKKNDDTSRFVGLALLKPVLEQTLSSNDIVDREERCALVQRCWDAIPGTFMNRLLKARATDKRTKEEASNMVNLAVAISHAFITLLESPHLDEKLINQIPSLLVLLRSGTGFPCEGQTRTQIMGILHALAMTPEGPAAIFKPFTTVTDTVSRPEPYLFITMLLIDVRSKIPSLQEKLHANDYSATSERLCRAYDILSAFIGFLVQSLEAMFVSSVPSAPMPVEYLLKLRTNISETMSLTIEHLRDRYDSSIAGAAGLDPSARASLDQNSPLPIAWDTSTGMFADPLTLSQLRTISLWLRDEENDALRKEAAGIMDVLLALYQHEGEQDFRSPVLVALQGITETIEGVEAFLQDETWWTTLTTDLTKLLQEPSTSRSLGTEIIRILLAIVEAESSREPKEEWLSIITLASNSLESSLRSPDLELPIAVAQLAIELLTQLPRGPRKRYSSQAKQLLARAKSLLESGGLDGGDREGLEEVVDGLLGLELNGLGLSNQTS